MSQVEKVEGAENEQRDRFSRLALATAMRCEECKNLKEMIRIGFALKLLNSHIQNMIDSLEKHIKDNHPDRYEYWVREKL